MSARTAVLGAGFGRVVRPLLFSGFGGDAEAAHEWTIRALARAGSLSAGRAALRLAVGGADDAVTVVGVRFRSRVGLAAGMDKDGLAVRAWGGLGFGFAEVGTVTAHAQPGNERPRLFRLRRSGAFVNRMGFNNAGAAAMARTLSEAGVYRGNLGAGIPVGVSIGKTKVVPLDQAVPDYLAAFDAIAPHADYVAVNVSSPNTPGLRDLQGTRQLRELTAALTGRAAQWAGGWRPWLDSSAEDAARGATGADSRHGGGETGAPRDLMDSPTPIFVKIAPDLTWEQIDDVLEVCQDTGVAGVIAVNTTLSREGVVPAEAALAQQAGGLSGRPLTLRAREVVGYVAGHTSLPVIGSGGVMTAQDAGCLFDLGASLVQLYTGFVYGGPALALAVGRLDTPKLKEDA